MRFEQHVYGRVTRGFRSSSPGFQVAALTESLLDERSFLEGLNRFSFCQPAPGHDAIERYSVFRPALGWMAFGCARMAKDQSGAVGSFAHNFVCSERDFIESGASPVSVLRSLTFLRSEAELPRERSLESLPFDPPAAVISGGAWRGLALELVDAYLGGSAVIVPLVVLDVDQMWELLDELFGLLPRREAARLSFSTNFIEATPFLDGYRLVFVPSEKDVPRDESGYRVIHPEPGSPVGTSSRAVALSRFWRLAPNVGDTLCRWVDQLRARTERPDDNARVAQLLAVGAPFRDAVESLDIKGMYWWLSRNPSWVPDYRRTAGPLSADQVQEAVWSDPHQCLSPTLDALVSAGEPDLALNLLDDLGRRLVADKRWLSLVDVLAEREQFARFVEVLTRPPRFDDRSMTYLADRLSHQPYYSGQLHRELMRRVLAGIVGGQRCYEAEHWVAGEGGGASLARVLTALIAWMDASTWRRGTFRLRDFQALDRGDYVLVLQALWRIASDVGQFAEMAFHESTRGAFFDFCARKVASDGDFAKDLLTTVVRYCPVGRENGLFIEAVLSSAHSGDLAKHYLARLERERNPDQEAIERLRRIIPKSSSWFMGG